MVPSACHRVDGHDRKDSILTGHERIVRNPAGPAPVRRPNSVRRTSTIDTGWPGGFGQPVVMVGRARDVLTGPDGGPPKILAEDSFRIGATARREILDISVEPHRPSIDVLVGARGGTDLADHYASADVFLFPSLTETYGNVTPEALASGLAVLAFNTAAAADWVQHEGNGWLVPMNDELAYLQMATELACDPQRIARAGERARAQVARLDWQQIASEVEAHFLQTMGTH